jgi:hypothetical protein
MEPTECHPAQPIVILPMPMAQQSSNHVILVILAICLLLSIASFGGLLAYHFHRRALRRTVQTAVQYHSLGPVAQLEIDLGH